MMRARPLCSRIRCGLPAYLHGILAVIGNGLEQELVLVTLLQALAPQEQCVKHRPQLRPWGGAGGEEGWGGGEWDGGGEGDVHP